MKSEKDVKRFKCLTQSKWVAGAIDIVEVRDDAGNLSSFKSVLDILRRTKKITCLTLNYSFPPALRRLPMAHNRPFRNLTSLNVNVPHNAVALFLRNHPRITHLILGTCNASRCPLIGSPLPLLQQLTCPPGCVQALISAGSHLTSLAPFHGSPQDASFPMPRLLNFSAIVTSSMLTVISIDFHHTTVRLLQRISAAAPALTVLRLNESRFTIEVCHSFVTHMIA
jgi:hypothetical protein